MNTATEKGPHTDPIAVSCPVKTDLETQEVNWWSPRARMVGEQEVKTSGYWISFGGVGNVPDLAVGMIKWFWVY